MSKIKKSEDKKELYKFLMEYFPGISVNFASHIEDAVIEAVDSVMSYPGVKSTATAVTDLRVTLGKSAATVNLIDEACKNADEKVWVAYKQFLEESCKKEQNDSGEFSIHCPHDITYCEYCFLKDKCTLTPKEVKKEISSCPTTVNFSGGCDGSCAITGKVCLCHPEEEEDDSVSHLLKRDESPEWNEIKSPENSGGSILKEAYNIINGERQDQYGNPEDSFDTIAKLWSVYMDSTITGRKHLNVPSVQPKDVAMLMTLLKIAREMHTHKKDNLVDAAGYISLANTL